MTGRSLGWVLLSWLVASCASSARVERGPEGGGSEAGGAAAPDLTRMLVLGEFEGHEAGDTVSAAIDGTSESGGVPVYEGGGGGPTVTAPLDALGIVGTGPMVVAADRADVRRCRSKGCSVIGYVTRGQVVRVRDYFDRWYRYTDDDGTRGYIWAGYLRAPSLLRRAALAEYRRRTADYYQRELAGLGADGETELFSGWDVELVDDLLQFNFYTARREDSARVAVCNAMRGIADFVEGLVAEAPGAVVPAYSAAVYLDDPGTPGKEDVMVAGLAGGGSVYCESP